MAHYSDWLDKMLLAALPSLETQIHDVSVDACDYV